MLYCCTIDVVGRVLPATDLIKYPEIRIKLLALMEEDQADRESDGLWSSKNGFDEERIKDLIQRDNNRAKIMLDLLKEIKTPSVRNVGLDGSRAVWLIALHNTNKELQKVVLSKMKYLYHKDRDQVFYPGIPYLVDIIMVESSTGIEKARQLYGTRGYYDESGKTQIFKVINEKELSNRRKIFGLSPLSSLSTKKIRHNHD